MSLPAPPSVELPLEDPPPEAEPEPEPPPEPAEPVPEPDPSEPPGLPACCVSCSFCCSALLTTEATLLLESFVMTLVLVSTIVLPFASVISLDARSPSSAGSTPNTVRPNTLAHAYPVVVPKSLLALRPICSSRAAYACTMDGTVMP
ncbi:MAG TPA: hypothetical protein DEV22_03890 [Collinsella sp.]|nr:hypothetical protein [Collinsella sp.]